MENYAYLPGKQTPSISTNTERSKSPENNASPLKITLGSEFIGTAKTKETEPSTYAFFEEVEKKSPEIFLKKMPRDLPRIETSQVHKKHTTEEIAIEEVSKHKEVFDASANYSSLFPGGSIEEREHAVRHWLSTTKLHGATVKELIPNHGKNNKGVFKIDGGKYFVKLPTGSGSLNLLKSLEKKNKEIDEKSGAKGMPVFAHLLHSGEMGGVAMGLFEGAQGSSLESLHDQWAKDSAYDMKQIYSGVGASMGSFHFGSGTESRRTWKTSMNLKAYTHGDANPSNIFVDPKSQKVTLIDNDDLNFNSTVSAVPYDLTSMLLNFKRDTFAQAGAERKNGIEQDLTGGERRVQSELVMLRGFANAYLQRAPEGSIREGIIIEFNEKLQGLLQSYLEASGLNKEEALKIIPEFEPISG